MKTRKRYFDIKKSRISIWFQMDKRNRNKPTFLELFFTLRYRKHKKKPL